jgi:hypothetical protein
LTVRFQVLDATDVGFNTWIKRSQQGSGLERKVSKVGDPVGVTVGLFQPFCSNEVLVVCLLLALLILALVGKTESSEQE